MDFASKTKTGNNQRRSRVKKKKIQTLEKRYIWFVSNYNNKIEYKVDVDEEMLL